MAVIKTIHNIRTPWYGRPARGWDHEACAACEACEGGVLGLTGSITQVPRFTPPCRHVPACLAGAWLEGGRGDLAPQVAAAHRVIRQEVADLIMSSQPAAHPPARLPATFPPSYTSHLRLSRELMFFTPCLCAPHARTHGSQAKAPLSLHGRAPAVAIIIVIMRECCCREL